MMWNWQKPDWPHFSWNKAVLRKAEERFLVGTGMLAGSLKHLRLPHQSELIVEAMTAEAISTSEIEGETLDRASVQSSLRKQLGFEADKRKAKPAEQGVAELMVDLYRSPLAALSKEMLFAWHRMLFKGRNDLRDVGRYRTDDEPMQVVSGALHEPKVHFEAPSSSRVPKEMAAFIRWFNESAPEGAAPLPALTRACIAHLYFESIHPFEDGNGRIGRILSEKALAQSSGQPTYVTLAATILLRRRAYYAALEQANKDNEITQWLRWFAGIALEAQQRTIGTIGFLIEKTKLLDCLRGQLNERQEKVLLRILREGPDGFKGGLSAGNYATISGASPATTTRDLADMVDKGALIRAGERRHAKYFAAIQVGQVSAVTIDENGELRSHEESMEDPIPANVDRVIRTAIKQKRLLRLRYGGRERIVEPHDYGVQKGVVRLLAYQVSGESSGRLPNWRWLDVPQISDIELLDSKFAGGRPNAVGKHHRWDEVFIRVEARKATYT